MLSRILSRAAFVALAVYTCGASVVLSYELDELEREEDRTTRVVQMLDLVKYWLRGKVVDAQTLPPGYQPVPIADSTPYWRTDAKTLHLFTRPALPTSLVLPSLSGTAELHVDEQSRFVDLDWSTP